MGHPWSAIRINKLAGSLYAINDDVTIYVAADGDDVNGDGSFGNPYATPHRAFEYLDDKTIGQSGSVTIKCAAGEYNEFPPLYPKHQNGEKISIVGEEPEVYRIKGCRTFDYEGNTAGSNIHQMGLIVATADANHISDTHAGWTSEHGLTEGDVNSSYMLIFNTSLYKDGYNANQYPFAKELFFSSLLDNQTNTGQYNWGNGNASLNGLQWAKIVGVNKIVGVTGAKARQVTDEEATSAGVDSNCGITIEKYQASTKWSVNDMWNNREGPHRNQRAYYNDWQETASATVSQAPNGRTFTKDKNIAVISEFGGATNAGHTAGFTAWGTPTTVEGRVLRTVFNCTSSGLVLEDGHKLGSISNVCFVADNNNNWLSDGAYGMLLRQNTTLGASGASWPDYPVSNIGILGFGSGVRVQSNSELYAKNIAITANRYTDGDSPNNHQGFYGISCTGNSTAWIYESVCSGMQTGFHTANGSYLNCAYSVATDRLSLGGWIGFDPGSAGAPGSVGDSVSDAFPSNYYIYQHHGKNNEPFLGRITSTNESTYRVSVKCISGRPEDSVSEFNANTNFFIDADQSTAQGRTGSFNEIYGTEVLPSSMSWGGRGFSVNNAYLAAANCIATGLPQGFVASQGGNMECPRAVATECLEYGFRGWLCDNVIAIDSLASRCMVGYHASVGTMYCPYTWSINNAKWNYYSAAGFMSSSKAISFEGFDGSLEAHHRFNGPARHCYNDFDGNSQYNINDDLISATNRGLNDDDNPRIVHIGGVNEPGANNIPRGYYLDDSLNVGSIYHGTYQNPQEFREEFDAAGDGVDDKDNFYENRKEHGVTGVPGIIDRLL